MRKTVFIRAIDADVDEKGAAIRTAIQGRNANWFDTDTRGFGQIPRSPFAYWVGSTLRSVFSKTADLAFDAKCGMGTLDDFRFLRLAWEPSPKVRHPNWPAFAKGGTFSRFYSDIYLVVDWVANGAELKTFVEAKVGSASRKIQATSFYFRPGLTWPRRTQGGLSLRVMPRGCIFADKGPAAFVAGDEPTMLLALAGVTNSRPFSALVDMQMSFGSYEVGVIQRTPVPHLAESDAELISGLARKSWSLKRRLDTRTENSHAFVLPALLQTEGNSLVHRAEAWEHLTDTVQEQLAELKAEIDDNAYRLYGLSVEDRQRIEQGFGTSDEAEGEGNDNDGDEGDEAEAEAEELDAAPMVASLLSWTVGVAFGRFDVRLATGERAAPPEPEPFDPLPVCSPGMLTGNDGLPLGTPPTGYPLAYPADGILVDDPGHPRDLVSAVRSVFDTVFATSTVDANARWHEAAELLGTEDLRSWFAHDFFEPHIKRYSKSRRKAPIYWQLGTASGSYSVWLYIHRATSDTLFKVLNDFVGPKLDHEKSKLDGLTQEAGASPSAAQRREIDHQETFVGELQALKTEVARVAPLWSPNLDDGVILNFAPLWRLVPQSRSWQAECKKAWDKLQAGDYEWAHLAMHLWPERVVPKCIDDRSLAIAHGLEAVFWEEDASGTWQKSEVDESTVHSLIATRTSSSVKAALKDLLSAPTSAASKGRTSKARSPSPRTTAPKPTSRPKAPAPEPKAPAIPSTAPIAVPFLDPATLDAVKSAIASIAGGASKADVLTATGLSESEWNKAITALLDRGEVTRTGQKRGTRYRAATRGVG